MAAIQRTDMAKALGGSARGKDSASFLREQATPHEKSARAYSQ